MMQATQEKKATQVGNERSKNNEHMKIGPRNQRTGLRQACRNLRATAEPGKLNGTLSAVWRGGCPRKIFEDIPTVAQAKNVALLPIGGPALVYGPHFLLRRLFSRTLWNIPKSPPLKCLTNYQQLCEYDKVRLRRIVRILNTFIYSRSSQICWENCCRILTTDVSPIKMIRIAVEHIGTYFFTDGGAPQTSRGPRKFSRLSPFPSRLDGPGRAVDTNDETAKIQG